MQSRGGLTPFADHLGSRPTGRNSAVERILKRVSGWAALSDALAFMKQNEIQAGIEECHRELTTCSEKFTVRHPYVPPRVIITFPPLRWRCR
jgi:hypothetical protein